MTKCFNLLQRESDVRQIWTASILLSTAVSSSAVTLGRYSGVALIGRPLDVQVQVLLAPGEDIANQCLGAEVYYGDFQLAPNLVTATPRGGASETDGLDVTSAHLGGIWNTGMLVVQDGRKRMPEDRQNYKYLPWTAVAKALGLE